MHTGIKATQVNYRSMTEAASGVTAGELDFAFIDNTTAGAMVRQNRLKVIAVTQASRLIAAPSIPTMMESGLAKYEYTNFWAAWLPRNSPAPIAAKLSGWINEIVALDETKEFFQKGGVEALGGNPEDLARRMKEHNEQWIQIVKETKLEPK
jgi:tripartite-type tricarboxylate transporter receptor subunit TctC